MDSSWWQPLADFTIGLWRETDEWKRTDWILAFFTVLTGIGFCWKLFVVLLKSLERALFPRLMRLSFVLGLKQASNLLHDFLRELKTVAEFAQFPHRMLASAFRSQAKGTAAIGIGLYIASAMPYGFGLLIGFFSVGWGVLMLLVSAHFFSAIRNLPTYVEKRKKKMEGLFSTLNVLSENISGEALDLYNEVVEDMRFIIRELDDLSGSVDSALAGHDEQAPPPNTPC